MSDDQVLVTLCPHCGEIFRERPHQSKWQSANQCASCHIFSQPEDRPQEYRDRPGRPYSDADENILNNPKFKKAIGKKGDTAIIHGESAGDVLETAGAGQCAGAALAAVVAFTSPDLGSEISFALAALGLVGLLCWRFLPMRMKNQVIVRFNAVINRF